MFHSYLPLSVVSLILFVGTTISKTLYVSIFDNFTINCPLKSEGIKVNWNGPPSMTPYGSNGNVNGRIKGIDIIGDIDNVESSLVIYGFHESNEGAYQCATVNDGKPVKKDFTVILQNRCPVFLRQSKKTHYGNYGDSINIKLYIYSIPEVRGINTVQPTPMIDKVNIKLGEMEIVTDTFHNITVNVLAYVAVFSISVIDSDEYFTNYTIQAENEKGKSCFTFQLKEHNCSEASTSKVSDLPVYITVGIVLFLVTFATVGYLIYKSGNLKGRISRSENSNTAQEEGLVFNNIYGMNENQQPIVQGAAAASGVYSNFRRDEVLRNEGLASGPLISQKKPIHQQPVKEELSELNYIEIELNQFPEKNRFHIHGHSNRTEYSDIEFGVIGDPLSSSESEMDDDNDIDTI